MLTEHKRLKLSPSDKFNYTEIFYHSWSRKIDYKHNSKWSDWSCKYCKKIISYDQYSRPESIGCLLEL